MHPVNCPILLKARPPDRTATLTLTYLFPLHPKRAKVRVRVAVRFGIVFPREFSFANFRESQTPKIPGGNSGGNYGEFIGILSFFPIFIVDSDILVFNLTHCIMCMTHDRLTAF